MADLLSFNDRATKSAIGNETSVIIVRASERGWGRGLQENGVSFDEYGTPRLIYHSFTYRRGRDVQ